MPYLFQYYNHNTYARETTYETTVRPVHLLRVFLLRVLESNFPGDSL